ncbi:uncharacterized protein [Rutidosis leptorrhynchoides]|uniref:uncharacterized protein n=1 Tax=Rutidosis leptorrhynchoides TaxID=125765 RepID=UPI003A9A42AF
MFGGLTSQPLSSIPVRPMEPVSNHDPSPLNNQIAINQSASINPAIHGAVKQTKIELAPNNDVMPTPLLPTKRKPAPEPLVPNKRAVHTGTHVNSPRLSHQSSMPKKKTVRNESMLTKTVSPRVQTPKSKTVVHEVSPKFQNESCETVRMKMRDTLAAALSVGNQGMENVQAESAPGNTASHAESAPKSTGGDTATDMSKGEKTQYNYVIPDAEGSFDDTFFVKDDLLQGNGLSWAWDMDMSEPKEAQTDSNNASSPQVLAVKIEAELFKLFGGANKKYKEKGRSLMFNLKDPNNPELREKVLSSKISPERLCSMTPEDLASKELSEWRLAKAEELDKMIVLPDSDADMRRLVKKTHKGEYQVEVDQDDHDGVSVEVSVGSSSLNRFQEKIKTGPLSTDGTDLLQELIVDEFKDEGFLQPIVSLDEFMESLDSEPPFENLPADGKEIKGESDKENSETGTVYADSVKAEATTDEKLNVKIMETVSSVETSVTSAQCSNGSMGERLWEGDIQLTFSSVVPVIGIFKSGERTSTEEWPGSMEIKGRVRLPAFEKFLKELPMSRTRAVMVVHFVLKDASSEHHRASLSEAMDSYVAEERVGFGEPRPGVELYFCPPHPNTIERLSRLLSEDNADILKSTENGLTGGIIGVVIWRRPMLPNASNHKHHRKHLSSRKRENITANANLNFRSKSVRLPSKSDDDDDDDVDDVPPGFGPGVVARDEDDLPEFSFSKGANSSGQASVLSGSGSGLIMPDPRPVGHMRQLIYEYGQSENKTPALGSKSHNGIENKHWNVEDDDDIPEWKPQVQNYQGPQVVDHRVHEHSQNHLVNQVRPEMGHYVTPFAPNSQPVNLMQNSWVQIQSVVPYPPPPNAVVPGQWRGF